MNWDRHNLAARLERFGDQLMSACEQGEAIENRMDVCAQAAAVCNIVRTLKALRTEARNADPDDAIAGSAVRRYAGEFAAGRASARGAAVRESDTLVEAHASDDGGCDG